MGKITTAVFEPGSTTANVYGLWQYDYGQTLRIQGLHLPSMVAIHFSLQETGGTALNRVGVTKDGVTDVIIPDSMLENDGATRNYDMFAFVYLTDDTSGQTEYKIKLQVKSRPKPEVFDGGENPNIFHEAVQAVKKSADKAAESEKQAEGWAHGREDLPERAQDNAKYYSDQTAADAKKTGTDRKEVERLVESVSGIDQQVATVENLTKQAQISATNAALSEQAAKTAETNAQAAQAGAETAEGNAELAEQGAKASEQAVQAAVQEIVADREQIGQNKADVTQLKDDLVQLDSQLSESIAEISDELNVTVSRIGEKIAQTLEKAFTSAGNQATGAVATNEHRVDINSGAYGGGGAYVRLIITPKRTHAGSKLLLRIKTDITKNLTGRYEIRKSLPSGLTITELIVSNNEYLSIIDLSDEYSASSSTQIIFIVTSYTRLDSDAYIDVISAELVEYQLSNDELNTAKYSMIIDKATVNLVDSDYIEHNTYYDGSNGERKNGGNYLSSTGLIPVSVGKTYILNRYNSTNPQWSCWGADGTTFITGVANQGYSYTIPDNSNIKYVRASILISEEDSAMIVEGTEIDYNDYWEYGKPRVIPKTQWSGKKIAMIGDSLTQMGYWEGMLASILGMDYTVIAQYGGNMTAISSYVEQLSDDIDILTVWAGTNDFANGISLGSFGSFDRDTYCGALNHVIEYCSTHMPKMKILLITPMQRFDTIVSSWSRDSHGAWINPNTSHTLEAYANAVVEYGKAYSIPVLDMYHESGINEFNMSVYSADLLHPTRKGFQKLCWKIIEKVKSM